MSQIKNKTKERNMISVNLADNESKKIPLSALDAYALKKYKTFYESSKSKVRADIKQLSIKYNTIIPKDITVLLFSEMLPPKEKKEFLEIHKKDFTKFMRNLQKIRRLLKGFQAIKRKRSLQKK